MNTFTRIFQQSNSTESTRFAVIVSVLFFGFAFLTLLHHEMWRDELQAWRIATGSSSIPDLFRNLRYEGHPAVWHLSLYVLSRFSDNPILMQVFHLSLATAVVFLLTRFAPFTRLQKTCFAFGYYAFFEYAMISRNYVIGVLGIFVYCILRGRLRPGSLALALLLAVTINTNVYAAIVALALAMGEMYELMIAPRTEQDRPKGRVLSAYGLIVAAGTLAFVIQVLPPADSSPHNLTYNTSFQLADIGRMLTKVWESYVPIPKSELHFWNTNVLDDLSIHVGPLRIKAQFIQAMLSIALLGLGVWMLRRTPVLLGIYVLATLGLLIFMHVKAYGGLRHSGYLFIALVACLWMVMSRDRGSQGSQAATGLSSPSPAVRMAIVTVIFAAQPIAGVLAVHGEVQYSFSAAKDVARFIHEQGLTDLIIIGSNHYLAVSVALHLNRPIYYAETERVGTFAVWKATKHPDMTPEEVVEKAEGLALQHQQDVLLVLSYDLGDINDGLIKLRSFDQKIIRDDEQFVLYLTCYSRLDTAVTLANSVSFAHNHRVKKTRPWCNKEVEAF